MSAQHSLKHGNEFPYDMNYDSGAHAAPKDWAVKAARGVLADLQDRGGIKRRFEDVDRPVRIQIVNALAAIIRLAGKEGK